MNYWTTGPRRPLMTFKTDHFTHYEEPELSLYAHARQRRHAVLCCSPAWNRTCGGNGSSPPCGCWPNGSACAG